MSNLLLNILNSTMMVYVFFVFFKAFSKTQYNKIVTSLIFILITVGFTIALQTLVLPFFKLVVMLSLIVLLSLVFYIKWYNRILLSVIAYALSGAIEYFVVAVISKLFNISIEDCSKGEFYVLGMFMSKVLLFCVVIIIRSRKHKMIYTKFSFNILPVLVVPISTIMVFFLQYNFYSHDFTRETQLNIISVICYGLLFLSNIIVFDIIDWIYKTIEQEAKLAMAEQLLSTQSEQYQNFFDQQKRFLQMKHDHKNFIIGVLTDLKTKRSDDAIFRMEQQLELINKNTNIVDINNVFELLIKYKERGLSEKNIRIDCDYLNLKKINIPSIDMAILLGNVIDNAIEATEKTTSSTERIIKIVTRLHNRQVIIVVSNPIEKFIDVENLVSTKSSELHGFGVISMKSIAEKYGGNVFFESEENVFHTHIILENPYE